MMEKLDLFNLNKSNITKNALAYPFRQFRIPPKCPPFMHTSLAGDLGINNSR